MRAWPLVLALALGGCDSCGGGGPVPFGLDGSAGRVEPDEEPRPDRTREAPTEGRALPAGTRRVEVEGAPIASERSLRALWAHDVDGDGDRDAILVAEGDPAEGPVHLLFARRDGAQFGEPRVLGRAAPAGAGCGVDEATIATTGPWLVARATVTCEGGGGGGEEVFVLSAEGEPRVHERLGTIATDEPGAIRLALGHDDVDEDGRDDLTVEVALTTHDREDRLNLHWLDRPSGLSRQTDEPNATLDARSREALRALRGDPLAAIAASRAVLRLHRAVCAEPGHARLRVGSRAGLDCGDSEGAGRAITTVVRGHAARGEAMAAIDAYAALEDPGRRINDERRRYARAALASLPGGSGLTLTEGPPVSPPPARDATLSALGFLDEDRVLVRARAPQIWTIGGELGPADPGAADVRVLDPQKRFLVGSLESRCGATRLRVAPTASIAPGVIDAEAASTPTLYGAPDACADAWQPGGAGWRLLGWAPQGIVAAREAELRVVPLDVSARPTLPPRTLDAGELPPAPLPAGAATLDGRFRVELRGPAVLLYDVQGGAAPQLLWPEGWADREGTPSHPAVSPSGRRVAVVQGGRVVLLERASN